MISPDLYYANLFLVGRDEHCGLDRDSGHYYHIEHLMGPVLAQKAERDEESISRDKYWDKPAKSRRD
jgi:hypothetical protein